MKRTLAVVALLTLTGVGAAVVYQSVARDRDYRALIARGDGALGDDQTFAAIEAYSGAIALRPDSMLAHLRLAETYQLRGNLDEAVREFRIASNLDTTAPRPLEELGDVLYQQQRYGRAVDTYLRALRLDDRSARAAYKLALAQYRDGDVHEALRTVTQSLTLDAHSADARYLLGLCLRDLHRPDDALRAFAQAVDIAPSMLAAHEELADLYRVLGRRSNEIDQLRTLAALDRDHVEREVALGLAHHRAGHGDLAVLTLGDALERSPNNPAVYGALGRVWLDRAREDPALLRKACEALERAATQPDASSETLTLYARALQEDGDAEQAARMFQQATTRFPVEPDVFLLYAALLERQNRIEPARRALVEYGALVADDPDFVSRAGRIAAMSIRLNDRLTAAEWVRKGLERDPQNTQLLALAHRTAQR